MNLNSLSRITPILQINWASDWPERPTVGSLHSLLGYKWFSRIILLTWLKHSYNSLAFCREQFVFLRTFTHPTHPSCIFTPPTNLITPLCCHSFFPAKKDLCWCSLWRIRSVCKQLKEEGREGCRVTVFLFSSVCWVPPHPPASSVL